MQVVKRDGRKEELNYDKIHKVLFWATEGLKGANVSDIEMNAKLKIYDGVSCSDIHKVLINSSADLISEENPDYQYVAARLQIYYLRKEIFGVAKGLPHLFKHITAMVKDGIYDTEILEKYTEEDIDTINDFIKHDRDFDLAYAGVRQLIDKYLLQDRTTGKLYETPQFMYMLIAMVLFGDYSKDVRLQYVRKFYNAISTFKINLPTPIMCGVRTPNRQYSSCTLIDIGDDLDSLVHSNAAVVKYTAKRAGIGLNAGRIRAEGSKVRNGEVVHTGVIPYLKWFESATKCCTQNGVRGGNSTTHFPFWHLEIENLIVLKNNKGSDNNRVRGMDYSIQLCRLFYKRVQEKGYITLFSPHEVPELYEAMVSGDNDKFEKIYDECEKKRSLRKKKVEAISLFSSICKERLETGRIYIMNLDNVNSHSSFIDPIYMSNLCQEITLPTKPISHIDQIDGGEIALCVLSGINFGATKIKELPSICDLVVRALDYVVEKQDYPVNAALHMKKRRSIGVGITNLSYFFAKNKVEYGSTESLEILDEYMEAMQYYLIQASINLAKEQGPCEWVSRTKYGQGLLPIDHYNKNVDTLHKRKLSLDWESLREDLKKYGIRNSTLSAVMPAESSAVVSNATNGIEPPRARVSIKKSKKGNLPQVVPEVVRVGSYYTLAWEMYGNENYINVSAVIQKYLDQAISCNHYYNPGFYENKEIPLSVVMKDLLRHYWLGGKTLYYANTYDGKTDTGGEQGCAGGACSI